MFDQKFSLRRFVGVLITRQFANARSILYLLKIKKISFAVECKTGEKNISPHLNYLKERCPLPAAYQVHLGQKDYIHSGTGIRVLPFHTFVREVLVPLYSEHS